MDKCLLCGGETSSWVNVGRCKNCGFENFFSKINKKKNIFEVKFAGNVCFEYPITSKYNTLEKFVKGNSKKILSDKNSAFKVEIGWKGEQIAKISGIEKKDLLFAEDGSYYGGHIEHSVEKFVDGYIGITKDSMIFVNITFHKKNKWFIKIPFNSVILNEVKEGMEDIYSTTETVAGIYVLGGLGMKGKQNIITIPYIDENEVKQKPKFTIKKKHREKFSKLFYERLTKLAKKTETEKIREEDPLKILKLRYAKGEISKKEYEEMKKELSFN